jgi:uncharacterized Zn finger protein (UPF0148 family)
MRISVSSNFYFEIICPMCGYTRWVEEKLPDEHDLELVKQSLAKMSYEERQKTAELCYEEGVSFVDRLKNLSENHQGGDDTDEIGA